MMIIGVTDSYCCEDKRCSSMRNIITFEELRNVLSVGHNVEILSKCLDHEWVEEKAAEFLLNWRLVRAAKRDIGDKPPEVRRL